MTTQLTGASLNQVYSKDKPDGMKKKPLFNAPLNIMYIEDGFNIRDINQEHVDQLAEAYKAGDKVPAIIIRPTKQGLKIIDGHHRYLAATQAGLEVLTVDEFVGDEKAETAFMIKSSQGLNLQPMERAEAYQRLLNQGATESELPKLVGRSKTDVKRHLLILRASEPVKQALRDGRVGLKAVCEELTKHGLDGNDNLEEALENQQEGDKAITTTDMKKQKERKDEAAGVVKWKTADANKVMEILSGFDNDWLKEVSDELPELVDKYRNS